MKIFRKIAAVLTAAVMAVSTFAAVSVTASADSIFDTAKDIRSGSTVISSVITGGKCADYKVNVSKKGSLSIELSAGWYWTELNVFDSDGNVVGYNDYQVKSGEFKHYDGDGLNFYWNATTETVKIKAFFPVEKGIYYIRAKRDSWGGNDGNGKLIFTATYPSTSSTAKINYITINMERGDTLSLGADMTGTGEVTWKSSKPKVAVVSSTGKITAKSKGTTVISAKCGKTTKKIKIKVS